MCPAGLARRRRYPGSLIQELSSSISWHSIELVVEDYWWLWDILPLSEMAKELQESLLNRKWKIRFCLAFSPSSSVYHSRLTSKAQRELLVRLCMCWSMFITAKLKQFSDQDFTWCTLCYPPFSILLQARPEQSRVPVQFATCASPVDLDLFLTSMSPTAPWNRSHNPCDENI